MANKKINEMSTEKLLEQQKTLKLATGFLIGLLIVSFIFGVFTLIQKGLYTSLITSLALSPIVVVSLNSLKEIKNELTTRERIS